MSSDAVETSSENPEYSDTNEETTTDFELSEDEIQGAFNENPASETKNGSGTENTSISEARNGEIPEKDISDMPENVQQSFSSYENGGWSGIHKDSTPGTRAGGNFENRDGDLPSADVKGNSITYKEFDVNNKSMDGSYRDNERFVVGSDGSVYYTGDHYDSFTKIK